MAARVEFCTYFDHRYLARGLALYESLRDCDVEFRLWVLCLDDECHRGLTQLALPGIIPIRLSELEQGDPALLAAKSDRTTIEYYFTCTPVLMWWLFTTQLDIDVLTYLDADLYFFADPRILFDMFADSATLIIPHGFSERNAYRRQWGIYNVGWLSFRRCDDGLACLGWWRQSCLDWCHDYIDGDRFADQKYLDQFPARFRGVLVVDHPGINLAPWNLDRHKLSRADGVLLSDGQPLVFFHFHGLRRVASWLWKTSHPPYGAPLDRKIRAWLYHPYLRALKKAEHLLGSAVVAPIPIERIDPSDTRATLSTFAHLSRLRALLREGGLIIDV